MKRAKEIVVFSGGRGATSIIRALTKLPGTSVTMIVNAYDDGRSTGIIRKLIPGILGPSDIRKNFSNFISNSTEADRAIRRILEYRISAESAKISCVTLLSKILNQTYQQEKGLPLDLVVFLSKCPKSVLNEFFASLKALYSYLLETTQDLDLSDMSFGNLILSGEFLRNGRNFNLMIQHFNEILPLTGHVYNVDQGENRYLVALQENFTVLPSEAAIVEQKSNQRIQDIFLLEKPLEQDEISYLSTASPEEKISLLRTREKKTFLSDEAANAINKADLIIFSPGTQFSSLYPSYLAQGLAERIFANTSARKVFITNIGEDSEIPGASANDLITWATHYLNRKGELSYSVEDYFNYFLINDPHSLARSGVCYIKYKSSETCIDEGKLLLAGYEDPENPGRHSIYVLKRSLFSILTGEPLMLAAKKTLSIIIPAYNEEAYIGKLLKLVSEVDLSEFGLNKEIIVVDDGSKDDTFEIASKFSGIRVYKQSKNQGKGAAVRKGIELATGDAILIQDADLEYDPNDYRQMLDGMLNHGFSAVYGSRVLKHDSRNRHLSILHGKHPASYFAYYFGGQLLSLVTFGLYGSFITDTVTAYKLYDSRLLKSIPLFCSGFELDHEITAKVLKRKVNIYEVPISYNPRTVAEGKKITWKDGIRAILTLLRFRFTD